MKEYISPSSTAMKASGILQMSGCDEADQYISPTNIPGPQEPKIDIMRVLGNNGMCSDIRTRKEWN